VRWGILGTGGIARQFTRDLLLAGHAVSAVGSRTRADAQVATTIREQIGLRYPGE
jgi:hypothetical protein